MILTQTACAFIQFASMDPDDQPNLDLIYLDINGRIKGLGEVFTNYKWERPDLLKVYKPRPQYDISIIPMAVTIKKYIYSGTTLEPNLEEPKLTQFKLKEIDDKRIAILTHTNSSAPFLIDSSGNDVYSLPLKKVLQEYTLYKVNKRVY